MSRDSSAKQVSAKIDVTTLGVLPGETDVMTYN